MSLGKIGQKVASFFKETTPLDSSEDFSQTHSILSSNGIADLLPYRLYDPSTGIFENENSLGFLLECMPSMGLSSANQAEISSLIKEIGEEGAAIQCLMWADSRVEPFLREWAQPRMCKGGIFEKVATKKAKHLISQSLEGVAPARIFRFFFSFSIDKSFVSKGNGLEKIAEKKAKAKAALSRITAIHDPAPSDFLEILSGLVNYSGTAKVESRQWKKETYLSKQIPLPGAGLEIKSGELVFKNSGHLFRSYEAIDFPDHWSINQTGQLIGDFLNPSYRIDSPFYLHLGVYFPSQTKMEAKFRSKQKVLEHQFKFPSIVKLFPDMPREREENFFVQRQLLEGERFVEVRVNLGLWSSSEKLSKSEDSLISLYQKYGFKLKPNHFQHLIDFIQSMPMTWGESSPYMKDFKRRRLMRTTLSLETGNFSPLVGEWWGNSKEGMILSGRRGQIASWDPFATHGNLNAVVVGPSGSGKSVFIQELIMSELGRGGRVFVLDLGRSYEKLCHLLEGEYLFFNEASNLNLNPFEMIKGCDTEGIHAALEMTSSIIATMAMPSQEIDKERSDILSALVKKAWERKGKKATVDDLIELIDETSFRSELMKGATESLKEGLKKYSRSGSFRRYFYGPNPIDFKKDLVVIETEELKNIPDLQAVILQIFALTISNEVFMGNREKRCIICIDEAWDLLKSPQMEGFIEGMARRLRKYNGALVIGTQGLKDFERSLGAKAAFQNSNWLLMLGRDNESLNVLKKENLIPMDEGKERALGSLTKEDGRFSEVFIYHKGSDFYSVNQLRLDPFSALLYSTSADDYQTVQVLKEKGLSLEDALEWMLLNREALKEFKRNGLSIVQAVKELRKGA